MSIAKSFPFDKTLTGMSLYYFIYILATGVFLLIPEGFVFTFIASILMWLLLYLYSRDKSINLLYKLPIFLLFVIGYMQRIVFLATDPDAYSFRLNQELTDNMLALTLAYVLIVFTLGYFFVVITRHTLKKKQFDRKPPDFSATSISMLRLSLVYLLFSLSLTAYLSVFKGVGLQGGEGSPLGFWIHIFDVEVGSSLVIIYAVSRWEYVSKRTKLQILTMLLLVVGFTVFRGSRSGLFSTVLILWFSLACLKPDLRIKRSYLLYTLLLLVVVGIPLYFVGMAFRYLHLDRVNLDLMLMLKDQVSSFKLINEISSRLAEVEPLSAVVLNLQMNDYTEYATIMGLIDASIKGLLPSFLYVQSNLSLDQVFPHAFRNFSLDMIHGEHWTGPGAFIAYFGIFWAIPLFSVFFIFCIRFGENIPKMFRYREIGYVISIYFSYIFFYGIISSGTFTYIIPAFARFLIIIFGLDLMSRLLKPPINQRSIFNL